MSKHLIVSQVLLVVLRAVIVSNELDTTLHTEQRGNKTLLETETALEGTGDVNLDNLPAESFVEQTVASVHLLSDQTCNELRKKFKTFAQPFMLRMYVDMPVGGLTPFAFEGFALTDSMVKINLEQTESGLMLTIGTGSSITFEIFKPRLIQGKASVGFNKMSGDFVVKGDSGMQVVIDAGKGKRVTTDGCVIENFKLDALNDPNWFDRLANLVPSDLAKGVFLRTLTRTMEGMLQNLITDEFRNFLAQPAFVEEFKASGTVKLEVTNKKIDVQLMSEFDVKFSLTPNGFEELKTKIEGMKQHIAQMVGGSDGNTMVHAVFSLLKDMLAKRLIATQMLQISRNAAADDSEGPWVYHNGRLIDGLDTEGVDKQCIHHRKGLCLGNDGSWRLFRNFVREMLFAAVKHFKETYSITSEITSKIKDAKEQWANCSYYVLEPGGSWPIAVAQLGDQMVQNWEEKHPSLAELEFFAEADTEVVITNLEGEESTIPEERESTIPDGSAEEKPIVNLKLTNLKNQLSYESATNQEIHTLAPPGLLV